MLWVSAVATCTCRSRVTAGYGYVYPENVTVDFFPLG